MIFGIGLPRSGGQSLVDALQLLTGRTFWHSITGAKWSLVEDDHGGVVEVYAPFRWLERYWPGSSFIANHRDPESWLKSCQKVYIQSQTSGWNHPIWEYPPTSWLDYYNDYWSWVDSTFPKDRVLYWNIIEDPSWDTVCSFLDVPVPEIPFPNHDFHGRPKISSENYFPKPW